MIGKPAPMDDEVLELTRKCAEVMGADADGEFWREVHEPPTFVHCRVQLHFDPASDPAQAFELLCWLAERGTLAIRFGDSQGFAFIPLKAAPGIYDTCTNSAELRLAIMRAVCKVKEK